MERGRKVEVFPLVVFITMVVLIAVVVLTIIK